ncbi:hypothetical protein TNCV_2562861 [Trichonephila clavipes]|uniref:Uncharacterized protein n=1 Tax=Trichonephila clavipes TaxID=2585209 RepID=A0A8X6RB48_TRICX|nr:hypothetical protein TNCV_2562861 [Trichonephila clavipes]
MRSPSSALAPPLNRLIYTQILTRWFLCYPLCSISPPGGDTAYQLLHRSINRQAPSMVVKSDANLPLSPTFRSVSTELPL